MDFHRRAAEETLRCLDALGIGKCIFWGHSDGAVIAVWLGLTAPERCRGLILEALHYFRDKPGSRAFFEAMASAPESFGAGVAKVLANEHGEPYWRQLMRSEGQVWLDLARSAWGPQHEPQLRVLGWGDACRDLYDGRLSELTVPTLIVHGARDPRTEPGELDAVRSELSRQQPKDGRAGTPLLHPSKPKVPRLTPAYTSSKTEAIARTAKSRPPPNAAALCAKPWFGGAPSGNSMGGAWLQPRRIQSQSNMSWL